MAEDKKFRRRRRVRINDELLDYIFTHPDNTFAKTELPNDVDLMRVYEDPARSATYIVYQSDEWEPVPEGEVIPEIEIEVYEIECRRCGNEMMYNEDEGEQYCPNCERRFRVKPK